MVDAQPSYTITQISEQFEDQRRRLGHHELALLLSMDERSSRQALFS